MASSYPSEPLKGRDLLSVRKTLERIEFLVGGSAKAKDELVDRMLDGTLDVYARYSWQTRANIQKNLRSKVPESGVKQKKKIKPKVLRRATDIDVDRKTWNWRAGNFFVTQRSKDGRISCRYVFVGVRFKRRQIEAFAEGIATATRDKSKGGANVIDEKWAVVWARLVDLVEAGELDRSDPPKFETFLQALRVRYEADSGRFKPFGEPTLRKKLQPVFNALNLQQPSKLTGDQKVDNI